MTEADHKLHPELIKIVYSAIDSGLSNPAIARSIDAWGKKYDLAFIDPDDEPKVRKKAAAAFRRAMPPLSGRRNIQNFIACTAFAMVTGIIERDEARELFSAGYAAFAALSKPGQSAHARSGKIQWPRRFRPLGRPGARRLRS